MKTRWILTSLMACGLAPTSPAQHILWGLSGSGPVRASGDGSGPITTLGPALAEAHSVVSGPFYFYWSDITNQSIRRRHRAGGAVEDFIASSGPNQYPLGLALDSTNDRIYWIETNSVTFSSSIFSASTVGPNAPALLVSGLHDAIGLQVDPGANKVYWAEYDGNRIGVANLTGPTSATTLFDLSTTGGTPPGTGPGNPEGIALDLVQGKIYWGDASVFALGGLQRGDLTGGPVEYLPLTVDATGAVAIDLSGGFLYFDTQGAQGMEIRRAPLSSPTDANVETLYTGLPETVGTLGFDNTTTVGSPSCSPGQGNSTGVPASLFASGTTLASANDLVLSAVDLPPGQFGYFLVGQTQGSISPPGSQGTLCLSGNIGRFNQPGQIILGPYGSLQVDLSTIPVNPPQAVQPGETWYFQCWYRDLNPGSTSNFTDSVSVMFQ